MSQPTPTNNSDLVAVLRENIRSLHASALEGLIQNQALLKKYTFRLWTCRIAISACGVAAAIALCSGAARAEVWKWIQITSLLAALCVLPRLGFEKLIADLKLASQGCKESCLDCEELFREIQYGIPSQEIHRGFERVLRRYESLPAGLTARGSVHPICRTQSSSNSTEKGGSAAA